MSHQIEGFGTYYHQDLQKKKIIKTSKQNTTKTEIKLCNIR